MGEYIDVGIQTSILPLSIILSSIVLGIFALFGEETENDDDDILKIRADMEKALENLNQAEVE